MKQSNSSDVNKSIKRWHDAYQKALTQSPTRRKNGAVRIFERIVGSPPLPAEKRANELFHRLISDLHPANPSHNLIMNNIHHNLSNNLNILRDRFTFGLDNIKRIIEYHNQQLVFFEDSMNLELEFINTNIFYNQRNIMIADLNIFPNNNNNHFRLNDR